MATQSQPIRVLVWSEELEHSSVYPKGVGWAVAEGLTDVPGLRVKTASPKDPNNGLGEDVLAETDVLFWWEHLGAEISNAARASVAKHVRERGMGFVALHSALIFRPFEDLLNTPVGIASWREDGAPEYVHVLMPHHPLAKGVNCFVIPHEEMYSEPFAVPPPDAVVFQSHWEAGEYFRSGCTWTRGRGRIFYFRPGHETYPTYFQPEVRRVLRNAAFWAAGRDVPE